MHHPGPPRNAALARLLQPRAGGFRLPVRVRPQAPRSALLELGPAGLEIALPAPSVDGAANQPLLELLAEVLGVAAGGASRTKLVDAAELDPAEAEARLLGALRDPTRDALQKPGRAPERTP